MAALHGTPMSSRHDLPGPGLPRRRPAADLTGKVTPRRGRHQPSPMALTPRRPAVPSLLAARVAVVSALAAGAALTAAVHAGAQPVPPVDPAAPPVPPAAAAPAQPFTVLPLAEGEVPPPAPPPAGAPYIPPVPGGDFNNTGQLSFLKELWNMRNSGEFFQSMYPGSMSPSEYVPPVPYGTPPPPPPGAPQAPASAPPPVWPPGRDGARTDAVGPSGSAPSGSAGYPRRVATSVRPAVSRRGFLALTAGTALLAACSSSKPGAVAKDGSVTVKHLFGETRIAAPPKRVVSAGFTEQDDLLAVGVVPVAVTNWWGEQPFGVWPWALPKLGGAQPAVLVAGQRLEFDRIAALKPDLIVATNAGVDKDTTTAVGDRADHPAVRAATRSSSRGRTRPQRSARRVQGRPDDGVDRRRRRQVHRGRPRPIRSSGQEGAAARGRLYRRRRTGR